MADLPTVPTPYLYNATVIDWHDGDTGHFEIDRGVYEYARWDIRLLGCNAAELSAPGGPEARDAVNALLPPGTPVVLSTTKPDKYGGRLDASVTYIADDGQPHDLVTDLIAAGWVAPWNGSGPKPVPPWPIPTPSQETAVTVPTDPQPQPVTNATGWAAAIVAVVGAVLTCLVAFGVITADARDQLTATLMPAIPTVVGFVAAILAGLHARSRVTPLARPRDAQGRALVPVDEYGRHAAPADPLDDWPGALNDDHSDDTQEIPRVTYQHIPEQVVEGKRLGRHVNHDPRSLSYLVPETDTPVTAMWTRRVPVFDQGNLGSCTGNAAAGVLGTSPFFETLPKGLVDDEKEAVKLYSAATSLDSYPGTYPPNDTGSDGLSVAKAAQKAGLISGYQHITSVAAAQTAIKTGPFIVGSNWRASMDNPDANGLVKVSGQIRGGHEYECHGYDAQADLWWFTNSWGTSWGKDGTFCMSSASFAKLLSEQGDATVFLPIAAPFPPQPTPTPPGPAPAPSGFPLAAYEAFHQHRYSRPKAEEFLTACDAWLNGGGS